MQAMFYPKNVPNIERVIRIVIGALLVIGAFSNVSFLANFGIVGQVVLVLSSIGIILTGFVGWCPACALVGRKLKKKSTE